MPTIGFDLGPNPVRTVADPIELARVLTAATNVLIALTEVTGTLDDITDGTVQVSFTPAERTKLTGIEAGATADQTDAEIKTAYENNADTNAFTDAEQTKLSGVEANAAADQTDAEIETAYNNQVSEVTQADAEAGTSTTVFRWTPERVRQAQQDVETLAWLGL